MALAGEAGELLEVFQWLTEDESRELQAETRAAAALEIADVVIYAVRLADVLGIDVNAAVTAKLRLNAERYPADRVRGSASKYADSGERT
jgi:NTP pyrophosphatase (non-canonical NTP hydrolase)